MTMSETAHPLGLASASHKRWFILAPSGAGKSTFAKSHPATVADVDDIVTPSLKALHDALSARGDWASLNELRAPLLKKWVSRLTQHIVLCHTAHDAAVMFGDSRHMIVVLPPPAVHAQRVQARGDTINPATAAHNYAVLRDEARRHHLPITTSFTTAMQVIAMMRQPQP